jgi:hypothetical protein
MIIILVNNLCLCLYRPKKGQLNKGGERSFIAAPIPTLGVPFFKHCQRPSISGPSFQSLFFRNGYVDFPPISEEKERMEEPFSCKVLEKKVDERHTPRKVDHRHDA